MDWLYLWLSVVGAVFTLNVWRPPASHRQLATASWIFGWLTGELALHWIVAQAVVTAIFAWLGAFESLAGRIGFGITVLSWLGLGVAQLRAHRAGARVEAAPLPRRLAYGALALALPPLLLYRTVARILAKGRYRGLLLRSLPLLALFVTSWGLGEVVGSWFGAGRSLSKVR